jgi:hypothetical protein
MSVYLVTNNYSFSIAKVQLFLKMMFFFGFLVESKQKTKAL